MDQVEFQVKDNDVFGAELIEVALVSAKQIAAGEPFDEWVPVVGSYG